MRPTGQLARDAWAETYARRGVWWGRPEDLTAARLRAWAGELWLGAIVRAAEIRPGPDVRVLEAGCGTAQYALALALQGCRVDALDVNATALERAAELAEGVGVTNEVRLLEGDLIAMPTADDAYDLVFNQQVMEYFVDDRTRQAAFADMVRTTKPGGRVVVVVARPAHPFARWWGLLGWPGFTDQPDMIELDAARLATELRAAGLVDVETDGIAAWRALWFWPRWYDRWRLSRRAVTVVARWLDRLPLPRPIRRRFGLQTLVVGTKPDGSATAGPSHVDAERSSGIVRKQRDEQQLLEHSDPRRVADLTEGGATPVSRHRLGVVPLVFGVALSGYPT